MAALTSPEVWVEQSDSFSGLAVKLFLRYYKKLKKKGDKQGTETSIHSSGFGPSSEQLRK